jgi:hypothetical protein
MVTSNESSKSQLLREGSSIAMPCLMGMCSEKASLGNSVISKHHRVYLHKPRWSSLLPARLYSMLL